MISWWRHQMETFSTLLAICAGNSPVPAEFPAQRLVTRSFDVFFDLRLNKRLSKQSWGWWFETLSCPLWRHCNVSRQGLFPLMQRSINVILTHLHACGVLTEKLDMCFSEFCCVILILNCIKLISFGFRIYRINVTWSLQSIDDIIQNERWDLMQSHSTL